MTKDYEPETDNYSYEEEEEKKPEIVKINPKDFGAELKVDPREADLDTERFVYNIDGSISAKVDENGCPYGFHWDHDMGRCVKNDEP